MSPKRDFSWSGISGISSSNLFSARIEVSIKVIVRVVSSRLPLLLFGPRWCFARVNVVFVTQLL